MGQLRHRRRQRPEHARWPARACSAILRCRRRRSGSRRALTIGQRGQRRRLVGQRLGQLRLRMRCQLGSGRPQLGWTLGRPRVGQASLCGSATAAASSTPSRGALASKASCTPARVLASPSTTRPATTPRSAATVCWWAICLPLGQRRRWPASKLYWYSIRLCTFNSWSGNFYTTTRGRQGCRSRSWSTIF